MHKILTKDTIIVFDIEATGLVAGVHSMISLGAVAYRNGEEISQFYAALKEWDGSVRSTDTMLFWKNNRAEWDKIRAEQRDIQEVITEFVDWVDELPQPRILAANPSVYDTAFLIWYLYHYADEKMMSTLFKRNRALDIRTYISALLAVPYSQAERSILPESWSEGLTITHNALDDAKEQGAVLMNLLKVNAGELELE